MEFKHLTSEMMKKLAKAEKYMVKAKECQDPDMAKIYHKMAQDNYEVFTMLHNLAPNKAKEFLGDAFTPDDKMFGVMHGLLVDWGHKIKTGLDEMKIF